MTHIKTVLGDITQIHGIDAVVNAANPSLLGGGGVDGAIHRAAGPELYEECRLLGGCRTGEAKLTRAYRLPCRYILHTVGPIYYEDPENAPKLLESCYRECLELSALSGIRSLAFPSISTGAYGYPVEKAAEIAVQTIRDTCTWLKKAPEEIVFVLFDPQTKAAYDAAIEKLW